MSVALTGLPAWAQHVANFQDYALVNKATLEVVGVDAPMIGLARNKSERKELIFRQTVILLAAFLLAPAHAWVLASHFSRRANLAKPLLQVTTNELLSTSTMKQGLTRLSKEISGLKIPLQKNDALRQTIIKAKANMLTVDLMLEGLIFANLGWIKTCLANSLLVKNNSQEKLGRLVKKNWIKFMKSVQKADSPQSGSASFSPQVLPYCFHWFLA